MSWYDNEWGFSNRMADTTVCDEQIDLNVEGRAAMAAYRTLDDLHAADVKGKPRAGARRLERADEERPDSRMCCASSGQAPTMTELADKGARVIVMSHFDRPGGKVVPSMSLKPVAAALTNFVGQPVTICGRLHRRESDRQGRGHEDGEIVVLENTRFHPEERKNDAAFANALASLGRSLCQRCILGRAIARHASTERLRVYCPPMPDAPCRPKLEHLHPRARQSRTSADGRRRGRQDLDQNSTCSTI